MYNIYEESTNTLMVSCNLVEALCNLNEFLLSSGLIQGDFIHSDNIQYHLDSNTMKSIIEGNLALVKRLNNAPSGFMISEQRFGQGMATSNSNSKDYDGKKSKKRSSGFASAKGFKDASKKFGF